MIFLLFIAILKKKNMCLLMKRITLLIIFARLQIKFLIPLIKVI